MTDICKDNKGKLSQTRVIALAWGLGVLGVWLFVSVTTGTLVAIPKEIVYLTLGMQGWKVAQSYKELSQNNPIESVVK